MEPEADKTSYGTSSNSEARVGAQAISQSTVTAEMPVASSPVQADVPPVEGESLEGSAAPAAPAAVGAEISAPASSTVSAVSASSTEVAGSLLEPQVSNRASVESPNEQALRRGKFTVFGYNRLAFLITGASIVIITLIGLASFALFGNTGNRAGNSSGQKQPDNYAVGSVKLNGVKSGDDLEVGQAAKLAINGQLKVNNTLVISPGSAPSSPAVGQIYYDRASNQPYFYNGTQFVSLAPQHVTSLGGSDGAIGLGQGLTLSGGQLSLSSGVLQQVATAQAAGGPRVSSLQGQTGDVTLSAGPGISINGTVFSNSGVVSLAAGSTNLTVSNDGQGHYTVSESSSGGSVTSVTGTANQINVSSTTGDITLSLPQDIATTSSPTFGGLKLGGLTANGVLYAGSTGVLTATGSSANSTLVTDGSGIPSLSQTLPLQVQDNLTHTGTLVSGSITAGFGVIATVNNITTTALIQGGALQITGGNFTVDANGNVVTRGALQVQGSGGLQVGVAGSTTGSVVFANTSNSHLVTLQGLAPAGQDETITVPVSTFANEQVCLLELSNCVGSGSSVTSVGAQNYISKFTNAAANEIGNSLLYDNGTSIGVGTTTPGASYLLDINGNLHTSGSATVDNGLTITAGGATITGDILQTNNGSLTTGTGVVNLNGATSVTGSNTLTVGTGATTLGGTLGVTGLGTFNGGISVSSGATITGLTNINVTGTGNTSIGNASGTFGLTSTGLNVTTSGALSGITGYSQTSGNFSQSGSGTFSTGTGAVTLNGATAVNSNLGVKGAGGITVGVAGTTAGTLNLANGTNANLSILQSTAPTGTGNATFLLPAIAGGGTDTICTVNSGNCAGSGGGIISSGTPTSGTIPVFTSTNSIGNSILTQSGTTLSVGGTLVATALQGDGSGVTNVNAITLQGHAASYFTDADNISSGMLADGRLSPNVTLLNQNNDFTGTTLQHNGNDICDTSGNCAGVGGGVTISSPGADHTIAMFTGAQTVADSILSQSGDDSTINVAGVLAATGALQGGTLSVASGAFRVNGSGNVTGGTYNTATISGGTLSGGSFTGGSVSAGTISGGTLSASAVNGLNVSGTAISGSGALSITAGGTNQNLSLQGSGSGSVIIQTPTFHNANGATYSFDGTDTSGVTATICTTVGNCAGAGGGVTTSSAGTNGTIALFTGSTTIANSILTQSGGTVSVGGGLTATGTVQGNIVNATTTLELGGTDINTAGTLSNVAYLNGSNNFTGATLQHNGNNVCDSSNNCSYAPVSGSSNYIRNGTASQTADFNVTGTGTVGTLGVGANATIGGTLGVSGATTLTGQLTANGGLAAGGASISAISGNITTTGLVQGVTVNATTTLELGGTDINTAGTLSNVAYLNGSNNFTGATLQHNGNDICDTSGNCAGSGGGIISSGTPTSGTIPVFTSTNSIGNSILTQSGTTLSVGGSLTATGTLQGNIINATGGGAKLELGGADINTAGTLSNVGYLNASSQTFTGANTFSTTGTALAVTHDASIGGTATIGTLGVTGISTLTGQLNANGGIATNNANVTTGTGTINTATISGGTLSGGSFTGGSVSAGTISGGTLSASAVNGLNVSGTAISGSGALSITAGGTNQNLSLQGSGSGSVIIQTPTFHNANGATYSFDGTDTSGVTATICTTVGNCAGAGGGVTTSSAGTNGTIALFTGSTTIANSILTQSGGTVTVGGTLAATALQGDGSAITNLDGSNIASGIVANAYLFNSGALTVTAGTGLSGGGSVALGGTTTLSVVYGSSSNTAAEGNAALSFTGSGNLTGTVSGTAGGGFSTNTLDIVSSPTFSGNLVVQGSGGVTVGVAGSTAGLLKLANATNSNLATLQSAALGQATTYNLPDPGQASVDICLSTGNCAGSGGGITGTGTTGKIAVFSGTHAIASSTLSDNGSTVTASGNMIIQGSNSLSLGTAGPSGNTGSLTFNNAANANKLTLQAGATASNLTFTLPTADGGSGYCLQTNGLGTLSFQPCTGGGAGGVTSLNTETGVLVVDNATGTTGHITINDASTSQKGIAEFNSTNFSASGGTINTIQDIATTSSPTFAGLTATGTLQGNIINATGGGAKIELGGTDINTAGTLSNVAYTNATSNNFTGTTLQHNGNNVCDSSNNCSYAPVSGSSNYIWNGTSPQAANFNITGTGTVSSLTVNGTGSTSLAIAGAPTNSATSSLIQIGNAIGSGNNATNGGTYIGLNEPSSGAGSAADFLNFQVNGTSKFKVTNSGAIVAAGHLSVTSSAGLSASGAIAFSSLVAGVVHTDSSGVLSSSPVVLGTDTSGNYVSTVNSQTGAVNIANATAAGGVVTLNDASTSQKGIAEFNSTNFSASGGTINTIQNIDTTAAPTFAGLTSTGTLTVQGAGGITVGVAGTTAGQLTLATAGTGSVILSSASQANAVALSIPADVNTTDEVCLKALANCAGSGGGIISSGTPTSGTIPVFTSTNSIGNSILTQSGTTLSVGGSLTATGTLQGNIINATGGGAKLELGGADINTAGTLSNVGYLNASSQTFTGANTFSTTGTALAVTHDASIGGTATIGTLGVTGISTLTGQLNANGGIATNNANVTTGTGTINTATISGGTLSGGSFTGGSVSAGTISGGTLSASAVNGLNVSGTAISGSGALSITAGGTNQNLSLQGSGSGSVIIQTPTFHNANGATYSFDGTDTSGVTATICTTVGNCAGAGGGVTTSSAGTNGTIALFTGSTTIANSILTQSGGTVSVGGGLTATGTVQGNIVNATTTLELGGTDINTAGTLSNVAYLNQAQTFTANNTFNNNLTLASSTTGLSLTGAPANNGTSSLIKLGNAIVGGNTATNGGTYLGLNEPSTGAGSAADFLNFQVNGASKLKVDNTGAITASTYNGQTISSAASFTGTLAVTGATTLTGQLNANGGIVTNNANISAGTGTITSGLINGQTISGTASFTGTLAVATSVTTPSVTSTGALSVVAGGSNQNLSLNASGSGTIGIGGASTGDILIGGGVSSTGCTVTNASGNLSCTGIINATGGSITAGVAGSTAGQLNLANTTNTNLSVIKSTAPTGTGNATYTLPAIAGGTSDTICTLGTGCGSAAGTAGGDLSGTYPNPTVAGIQGHAVTFTSLASGDVLQYNGTAIVNGKITNSNFAASTTLGNVTGVGALASGSIASGFGTISTGNTITTTAALQGGTVNGATITSTSFNTATISGGSLTASTVNGLSVSAGVINNPTITGTVTGSGTPVITGFGTYNGQTIGSASSFTGTVAIQGANALTLGTASSHTGAIVFQGSGGAGTLTLQGPATPNAGNFTLSIPAITGNANVCTDNSVCTGYAASTGANYIAKNAQDTSSASTTGNLLSLTNTNTGAAGVLGLTNSGTNSALSVTQSVNPTSGQALILATNTASTPTGNLLDLRITGSSEYSVDVSGNSTQLGKATTVGLNAQGGLIQGAAGLTITGGVANLNASSNNATNINTGTSTGTVSIGNSAAGAISLQSASTIGLTAGTTLTLASTGANAININPGGGSNTGVVVMPGTDSTAAFKIQNAAGTSNLFIADTTDGVISIGAAPLASTYGLLQVNGALLLQGGGGPGYVSSFTTPMNSHVTTKINIPLYDPGSGGQILALGLPLGSSTSARGISLFDKRAAGNNQPVLSVFDPSENDVFGLSWDGSTSQAALKTLAGGISLRIGNATTNTDVLSFGGYNSGSGTGAATFRGINGIDSVTAFQVQRASNAATIFDVDTANSRLGVNNSAPNYDLDVTGDINSTGVYRSGGTPGITTPCSSGQFLQNQTVVGGIVTGGTCALTTGLFKNAVDTSSAAVTAVQGNLYIFTNSSSAIASGVLKLDNGTNTNSALTVTASGNPTSGQALIFASNTNASPSGNLLDLQSGSSPTSKFSVSSTGLVTGVGGASISGAAVNLNTSSNFATNINTGTSTGAVGIGNSAAGAITVQSASTVGITAGTSLNLTSTGSNALGINPGGGSNTGVVVKPGTDSTATLQVQKASNSAVVFAVDTTNGRVGVGTSAPGNLLSIGALTTAQSGYQVAVSTGGTTNSGIVVQTVASQSAGYLLQAQDSTGATLASIDYQGNLSVKAAIVNGNLTLNGHLITGGTAPSTTVLANAGTGATCKINGTTGTGSSTDTAGTVTLVTGSGAGGGDLCTVNFGTSYGALPHVVLGAENMLAADLDPYVDNVGTGSFQISSSSTPGSHTFIFTYIVAQ